MSYDLIFVGEDRSKTAKRMGVRWEDGRLAAKQLFDAFMVCGFKQSRAKFFNLFERSDRRALMLVIGTLPLIGMGQRVQKELTKRGITFVPMVHPAARGAVRKKERYAEEVRRALTAAGVPCSA